MTSNLINRIESSASFKDVKYLIYREVWKWRQALHFKEMCKYMLWSDHHNCWLSSNLSCKMFNWRDGNFLDNYCSIYTFNNLYVFGKLTCKLPKNY